MEKMIKWTEKDKHDLKKAVRRFNRIAKNTENIDTIKYKKLEKSIFSRKELNRQLKRINSLSPNNARWWADEIFEEDKKLAIKRLERELKRIDKGEYLMNPEYATKKGEIENIKKLDKLKPAHRAKKIERIKNLASADYNLKDDSNYRYWYLDTMENYYKGFKGYDKLMKKLKKITNPTKFYNMIKHAINESDIFLLRYTEPNQAIFNNILEEWNIEPEDIDVDPNEYEK